MKQSVLALTITCLTISATGQTIDGSLGTGTFVESISPVINTISTDAPVGTEAVGFAASDETYTDIYDSFYDDDPSDGFSWDADMGNLPSGTVIWAEYYDINGDVISYSDDLVLDILPMPHWLVNGSVANVEVNGSELAFQGIYPIYEQPYTIPSSVKGLGGRSLNIAGNFVFDAVFDMSSSSATVSSNSARVTMNVIDQLPDFSNDIPFSGICDLDDNLNLAFIISDQISTDPLSFNIPKVKFPVSGGLLSISVDAGVTLYATLKGQIVIGQDGGSGDWGFIDNGGQKTKIIGVLTGEGFIRGKVSVLFGAASANASLRAKARLGAGYDYVSLPSENVTELVGGDLKVWGEVCYKTFWGLGPGGCKQSDDFYYDLFGDTSALGKNGLSSFDELFKTQSVTFQDSGTLVLPDFSPQPTFATRADNLYAAWLEHDSNIGYLLFSKLNQAGTAFSEEIVVAENENSISNPKIGILPSGSAIITWSQSRYDLNNLPASYDDEDLLQAQDVWFAVYDKDADAITYSDRLGDDFSNPQSGRPEGEASISVGDNNEAMITWVVKDPSAGSGDIWFTHLVENTTEWTLTAPAKLADLTGTNYDVNVIYVDSAVALAAWINDPDGNEDTYDNTIAFAEWDGNLWSSAEILDPNDGYTNYKDLVFAANNGYIAIAYTSTYYHSDNDFENRLEMAVYDDIVGDWDPNGDFGIGDSLYYFQSPQISISDEGYASICFQVVDMFPDTSYIDNGELYLFINDLNNASGWVEVTENTFLCDTDTYIWELTSGFSDANRYYVMTQEYGDMGTVTNPENGVKFGDPDLSMVLRGLQVNNNLTISDIPEPTVVPTGIRELKENRNFRLIQNYPNPFKQFTTIEYHLQKSSDVTLEIFNFTGSKVATLVNSRLAPGVYKTIFDAGDLPNGMYLSKLTVDGVTATGKLILVR